ncbi:MAG TPA: serine/threonine-protein kinase [Planctomycetaceae bacterium]|jgi:tRNA A-37 threonylcarbamoyl transferase component Bud32|nr:serine/threonine-protein kinase [Planctomycetaceae bacterium]
MTDKARVRELLEQLLETDSTPEEVCTDCPELLPEIRSRWRRLQTVQNQVDELFPSSPAGSDRECQPKPTPDSKLPQIEGYEVLEILGYGGMGVVYKARHLKLNRDVALKMLLLGAYARPHERERFMREAEAVAGLKHPNIVQVHDVGEFEGRPYFTMELIDGGSFSQQLAGAPQLPMHSAQLVATLASAVGYAHERGIVHRDLKPANILLTSDGTPKIADFGLARRLDSGRDLTMTGAMLGTPSYMAPEQASGKASAVGPATDVYGLGAILYEMLAGRPPFRGDMPAETQRQVLLEEPSPPSRWNAKVPRDLETICLKCLRKEPENRYASAAALSSDLTRFLEGRPIQARPLGWAARFGRWCRRNPMAAAFCLVLLVSAVFSSWQAARATRAGAEANSANLQAQKRLKQIERANELLGSIFENLDPNEVAGAERPLRAILVAKLDRAVEQLEGESIGDPLVVARMQERFAISLIALAESGKAVVLLEKAHATRQAALGQDDPLTLGTSFSLALAIKAAGNLDRALPLQEETFQRMKTVLGPDHPGTLRSMSSLAGMYDLAGKRDLSVPLFEETLRRRRATLGAKHADTLMTMDDLAAVYTDAARPELALPMFEETLSLREARLGRAHPDTLRTMSKLAMAYQAAEKLDLALPLLQETVKLQKEALGSEHQDTLLSMYRLSLVYQSVGKPKLALPLIEEVLRAKTAKLGKEHPDTRVAVNQVDFLRNMATAQDRYELNLAKLGPDDINTLLARRDIAQLYMSTNRLDEAERALVDVLDRMKTRKNDDAIVGFTIRLLRYCHQTRQRTMPDSWLTYRCKSLVGGVYLDRKQYAAAEPLLLAAFQGMKQREAKIPAQGKVHLTEAAKRLVQLYEATGKKDEAAKWQKELDTRRKEVGTAAITG